MIERVAYLSMHTSPLRQPGVGYAGGMNVYIDELARAMARSGVKVEVFTRKEDRQTPNRVTITPGYTVHNIEAGPMRPMSTERQAAHVRRYAAGVLDVLRHLGPIDVIHSHYWLSGWAGMLVKRELGIPMANSFHTLGRVKNLTRRGDDPPESLLRIAAEHEVIAASDCVVASTPIEADELLNHYGANPESLCVSPPGVDHDVFFPGDRQQARRRLGLGSGPLVAYVGRVQSVKGADVAVAAFDLVSRRLPQAQMLVVGGPSGSGGQRELRHIKAAAAKVPSLVTFLDPLPHKTLADVYRSADVVHVPSRSESFGLVAAEAQACGTPVVASNVGGLAFSVDDGTSGLLVEGWAPSDHADALMGILADPERAQLMGKRAHEWAERFSWDNTVDRFLELYSGIIAANA